MLYLKEHMWQLANDILVRVSDILISFYYLYIKY